MKKLVLALLIILILFVPMVVFKPFAVGWDISFWILCLFAGRGIGSMVNRYFTKDITNEK